MIRVGAAGWSYRDWEGIVYPARKPRSFHGLEYLARFTDCMEVNSSFYAMPRAEHAANWVHRTERESEQAAFHFTAKLHQGFTHGPSLGPLELELAARTFLDGVAPLQTSGRLAALLAQFPVSFTRTQTNERRLAELCATFSSWPLSFELRHRSWFEKSALSFLRERGVSLLHIDLPQASDHPPHSFEATGPIGYLRLHGRNSANWFTKGVGRDDRYDYLYGPQELDDLQATAIQLEREHDEVYVVSNNHFEGQAVANAIELRARLSGTQVPAPAELVTRYPRLRECTRPSGQQNLF